MDTDFFIDINSSYVLYNQAKEKIIITTLQPKTKLNLQILQLFTL